MANPRQRRKARSSAAAGSSATAKRAQRKKLHRAPPLKGPAAAIIGEHWDRSKTPRQNYTALGLVGDGLALRPSGGEERLVADLEAGSSSSSSSKGKGKAKAKANEGEQQDTGAARLRKGLGRIVRDADGNVVDIIEGGESADDDDDDDDLAPGTKKSSSTPWGRPFNDWDDPTDDAGPVVGTEHALLPAAQGPKTKAGEAVIKTLEARAAEAAPVTRHTSALEADWLRALVQAHGDDLDAMARDRTRNVWQKTPGDIRKAIKKAGGRDALLA